MDIHESHTHTYILYARMSNTVTKDYFLIRDLIFLFCSSVSQKQKGKYDLMS